MADIEAAKRALINADKAGDVEAARKLVQFIQSQQAPQTPLQRPLSDRLRQRGVNIIKEAAQDKPLTTLPYRAASEVVGGIGDIGGEALSAITPDFIEEPVKEYAGKAAEAIADTQFAKDVSRGYGALKQASKDVSGDYIPDVVETVEDVAGGAIGLGTLPVGGAVAGKAGLQTIKKLNDLNLKKIYPTTEAIAKRSSELFDEAKSLGADFSPKVIDDLFKAGSKDLPTGEIAKGLVPSDEAMEFTQKVEKLIGKKSTLADFEDLDKYLGSKAASTYITDPSLSRKFGNMQGALRESVENIDNVVGSKAGIEAHREATRLWSIKKKADDVERAISVGLDYEVPATGIKNQFKRIKNNPKLMRGYSKAEKAAISKAANSGELEGIVKTMGSRLNIVAGMAGGAGGAMGMTGVSMAGRKGSELYKLLQANKVMKGLGERSGLTQTQKRIDPSKLITSGKRP